MIRVTLEFETADEAIEALQKLTGKGAAPFPWPSREEFIEAAAAPEPAPAPEAAITPEQVRAKLAQLGQAGKRAEAQQLLLSFGVSKLSELDPEQYAAVMAAAEQL